MHQEQSIPVSVLTKVSTCPLLYYYEKDTGMQQSGKYLVCKQISLHASDPGTCDEIWQEILFIDPDIDRSLQSYLDDCLTACRHTPFPSCTDHDLPVYSRHGFFGMVDKIHPKEKWLAITRSSPAPSRGCYRQDRLRMAALITATEETLHIRIRGGYIEYIPSGIIRWYEPGPRDRREVLKALHMARTILAGTIPKRSARPFCQRCRYQDRCDKNPHKLSDLF